MNRWDLVGALLSFLGLSLMVFGGLVSYSLFVALVGAAMLFAGVAVAVLLGDFGPIPLP